MYPKKQLLIHGDSVECTESHFERKHSSRAIYYCLWNVSGTYQTVVEICYNHQSITPKQLNLTLREWQTKSVTVQVFVSIIPIRKLLSNKTQIYRQI